MTSTRSRRCACCAGVSPRTASPTGRALAAGLGILREADLRDALPRITLPALVIAGEHDRLTPPEAGRALASGLPAARFRLVERSGHAPFLSHAGRGAGRGAAVSSPGIRAEHAA